MLVDHYFYEPCRLGAPGVVGAKLDREKLKEMRAEFYQYKECDEDGIPTPQTLKRLGLEKFDTDILP
jgi:aldehyde:ferredoxin oxidoreductase